MRVYYDRLVDDEDKSWLFNYAVKVVEKSFSISFHDLFQNLDFDGDGTVSCLVIFHKLLHLLLQVVEDDLRSLMFCDFTPKNENQYYSEVTDVDKLREVVESSLDEFNNMSKKPMNLVIFR